MISPDTTFKWPDKYTPFAHDHTKFFTDVQKLFSMLVSKKEFTMKDIGKKFCAVGVRWLGFLCSLLHSSLADVPLRKALEDIPESDIPNKTVKAIIANTVHCLQQLNLENTSVVDDIFEFSVVYFGCWRQVVMSDGTNILEVTINTTKELAIIGDKLKLGKKFFDGLNNHLYNADGVFLPFSTNPDFINIVVDILDEAIEDEYDYVSAPFKRFKKHFQVPELKTLSINSYKDDSGFRARAANSPLFHHLGDDTKDIVEMYRNHAVSYWENMAKLVPGHNQACERLVGDLKRSNDIDTLVTISEQRIKRPRACNKNINKGTDLKDV